MKSFPYLAVHCLQYAQGEFAFEFSIVPQHKNILCVLQTQDAPRDQDNYLLVLERISLSLLHVTTFTQCVAWARDLYDEYLWKIEDTVLEHPEDEVDEGVLFWSPPKRFPCAGEYAFNWEDEDCRRFVMAAAILKARCCGVAVHPASDIHIDMQRPQARSQPLFSQLSARKKITTARANKLQALAESVVEACSTAESEEICRLVSIASSPPPDHRRIQPVYFNKDDPAHMYSTASMPFICRWLICDAASFVCCADCTLRVSHSVSSGISL